MSNIQEAKDTLHNVINNPELDSIMNRMNDMIRTNECSHEEVLPYTHLIQTFHESLSGIYNLPENVIFHKYSKLTIIFIHKYNINGKLSIMSSPKSMSTNNTG